MLDSEFHYYTIVYSVFYFSPKSTPNFTPLNKRKNYTELYFNIVAYIFLNLYAGN